MQYFVAPPIWVYVCIMIVLASKTLIKVSTNSELIYCIVVLFAYYYITDLLLLCFQENINGPIEEYSQKTTEYAGEFIIIFFKCTFTSQIISI